MCLEDLSHLVYISDSDHRLTDNKLDTDAATATFGALLFSHNPSQDITLVLKPGHDFPPSLLQTFKSWNIDLHTLSAPQAPSARGRVLYGSSASERTYQRLTAPLVPTLADLTITGAVAADCFHFFETAAEMLRWLDRLRSVRRDAGVAKEPIVVWEPQAKACSPEMLEEHRAIAAGVAVFSPNHAELARFFPPHPSGHPASFSREMVEEQARAFFPEEWISETTNSPSRQVKHEQAPCIIIRCAEHGCYVRPPPSVRSSPPPDPPASGTWLPPCHGPQSADRVVDPTGAGNAFLGGVAMSLLQRPGDWVRAARSGSVSASFAVECVGLPDVAECDAWARLAEMEGRMG